MEYKFNFNNEINTTDIFVDDETGEVTLPVGQDTYTFPSVDDFAEQFARLRHIPSDHLKNWTLVYNGNVIAYVPKASSGGVDVGIGEDQLIELLRSKLQEKPQISEEDQAFAKTIYPFVSYLAKERMTDPKAILEWVEQNQYESSEVIRAYEETYRNMKQALRLSESTFNKEVFDYILKVLVDMHAQYVRDGAYELPNQHTVDKVNRLKVLSRVAKGQAPDVVVVDPLTLAVKYEPYESVMSPTVVVKDTIYQFKDLTNDPLLVQPEVMEAEEVDELDELGW